MVRHQFTVAGTPWISGDRSFGHLRKPDGHYPFDSKAGRIDLATSMVKPLHIQEFLTAGRLIRGHYGSARAGKPWGSDPAASSGSRYMPQGYGASQDAVWEEFGRRDEELTR